MRGPSEPETALEPISIPVRVAVNGMEKMRAAAQAQKTTPLIVILAAFACAAASVLQQEHILVNMVTSGRDHPALSDVVSGFAQILPVIIPHAAQRAQFPQQTAQSNTDVTQSSSSTTQSSAERSLNSSECAQSGADVAQSSTERIQSCIETATSSIEAAQRPIVNAQSGTEVGQSSTKSPHSSAEYAERADKGHEGAQSDGKGPENGSEVALSSTESAQGDLSHVLGHVSACMAETMQHSIPTGCILDTAGDLASRVSFLTLNADLDVTQAANTLDLQDITARRVDLDGIAVPYSVRMLRVGRRAVMFLRLGADGILSGSLGFNTSFLKPAEAHRLISTFQVSCCTSTPEQT